MCTGSRVRYTLFTEAPSRGSWTDFGILPLIIAFGLGAHASTHALPVAGPLLERKGLSPMAYALLTLVPLTGQVLTPAAWGFAFAKLPRLTTVAVPLSLAFSLVLMACGLFVQQHWPVAAAIKPLFLSGLAVFAGSRAGIGVVQHASLASGMRRGLAKGLIWLVATTHLIGAGVQFCTGPILHAAGLLGVQVALLIPASVGVAAGVALSMRVRDDACTAEPTPPPMPRRSLYTVCCAECGRGMPSDKPWVTQCDRCIRASRRRWHVRWVVLLLGLWRASMVGALHAFTSVLNALLVEHGFTIKDAGSFLALTNTFSLVVLPFFSAASDTTGIRPLLLCASLLSLCGALALLFAQTAGGEGGLWQAPMGDSNESSPEGVLWWTPRIAVVIFALTGAVAPVLPLALVPANAPSLGVAYGVLDSIFYVGQVSSTLGIGAARQVGGFQLALIVLTSVFGISVLVAVGLLFVANEPSPLLGEEEGCRSLDSDLNAESGRQSMEVPSRWSSSSQTLPSEAAPYSTRPCVA